ncbi:MAG: 4-(cytidine 5'-diphospho)-2-C-methyl-D-erythritol kinase [Lachnospiraceae bacterium]|nr:4-(cytidine 5'-diphospho)-2-C-methyl-D-erythritol kinase [Lachnospiraceae bacterium]
MYTIYNSGGIIVRKVSKKAYAKVNLVLDVLRKREDGYHDVKMVMQNLNIYDELTFTADETATERRIVLTTNREDIPTDGRNLIYKAVELMFDTYGIDGDISIHLTKNIPVEAGMAGGSTDCAATLWAVNELFELGLDCKTLMELGVRLGADVPYCVLGKTALSEGIGEILTPVKGLSDCYVLVVKPPINVSTKMVYTNLRANELKHHPNVDGMVQALEEENLTMVAQYMENVLETVTVNLYPEIEEIKCIMKEQGAINSIMSGSGPTVFGIFLDEEKAKGAAEYIRSRDLSKEIYVTTPV